MPGGLKMQPEVGCVCRTILCVLVCIGSLLPVPAVPGGVSQPLRRGKDSARRRQHAPVAAVPCRRRAVPVPRNRLQTRGLSIDLSLNSTEAVSS